MGRRSPHRGAKKIEDFRQKKVERFKKLESDAINHIIGRNRHVAEVLSYLSMLQNAGAITHVNAHAVGAIYQSTRGSKALKQEAAHQLPCQVLIGGEDPTTLPVNGHPQPRRIVERMRAAFAAVTVADKALNTADKACERIEPGIEEAFLLACRAVIQAPSAGAKDTNIKEAGTLDLITVSLFPINRPVVLNAFENTWLPRSDRAYEEAMNAVIDRNFCLSVNDDKDEVIVNLGIYLRDNDASTILQDKQQTELELMFVGS